MFLFLIPYNCVQNVVFLVSKMSYSVSIESITDLFKNYEIENYHQTILLRGLKGGKRLIFGLSWLSIVLLMPAIILSVILFRNLISLSLALTLPTLIAICGVPMFLKIIDDEGIYKNVPRSWIAITISYFIFMFLWYLLAFSFELLLSILPQLLGLIIVFLGFEANFANIVVLVLGILLIYLFATIIIVYDWPCLYGFESSLSRALVDSLMLPIYGLLIIVVHGFVDIALYLYSRTFYIYEYVAVRKNIIEFHDDYFYKTEMRMCKKHIVDLSIDLVERYKEVRLKYRDQLRAQLLISIKSLIKFNKKYYLERMKALMSKYDEGFNAISDAETYTREYYRFLHEINSVIEFLKKYFIMLIIFSPFILLIIPNQLFTSLMGENITTYCLVLIILAMLYLFEITVHRNILFRKLVNKKYPLLFNTFIENVENTTMILFFIGSLMVFLYSIALKSLTSLIVFAITILVFSIGYKEKLKTKTKSLVYGTYLYFLDINPLKLILYNSSLEKAIKIIQNSKYLNLGNL